MGTSSSMTSRPGTEETSNTQLHRADYQQFRRNLTLDEDEDATSKTSSKTENKNSQAPLIPASEDSQPTLTDSQQRSLELVLSNIETQLKIKLDHSAIINAASVVRLKPDDKLLVVNDPPQGLFVVEEGVLQVLTSSEETVLANLMKGDVCGELSALLNQPCSATVRSESNGAVIKVPVETLQANISGRLSKEVMKMWCVQHSYIDTNELFPSGSLMVSVIVNAMKASPVFSNWSSEVLNYMATLCLPVLYSIGDTVATPGDSASHLFVFTRGTVSVEVTGKTPMVKKINSSDESLTVGEQDFFTKSPRKQKIRAVGPLTGITVTGEALQATVQKFPSEQDKLLKTVQQYKPT